MQRDALLELVPALIDKYGNIASEAAAQWYEQVRAKWFADDDYEAVVADLIGHDALTSSIRAKANMLWPKDEGYDPEGYLRYLTEVVDRNVKRGGRSTIIANGRRDMRIPRFARVPSGVKTCAFCSMLASRGFVYLSAETAGTLGQYHADCDCEIVPSWDKSPKVEGYDPEALYKDYELARNQAGDDPTTADILAAMRRQPNKYTDGASSGYGFDIRPGASVNADEERAGKWIAELGHHIVALPISNERNVLSPDFEIDGEIWELKTIHGSGKNTIDNALKRASKQSRNVIIDITGTELTAEKVVETARKRLRREESLMKRIWVLRDGVLVSDLRK